MMLIQFDLNDFGTEVAHRPGGCCPKCYDCAKHFQFFCQLFEHMKRRPAHKIEFHRARPEAIHSCGCEVCCKWLTVN